MTRALEITFQRYPIAGEFRISRGAKTEADVIVCEIRDGHATGRGECVPYRRYGETTQSVADEIAAIGEAIADGLGRETLLTRMRPGAARNAVDCALWDLEAKLGLGRVEDRIGVPAPSPLVTAYTLSLGDADAMGRQAADYAHRKLLKIKLGAEGDEARIRAVRSGAPESALILDANEGWSEETLAALLAVSAECKVSLIEQPLPAGRDGLLATIDRPVPVCADESVHASADLAALRDRYDAVNIKLDKTGGLTEALAMKREAERLGFKIMVGCMVGSSLAMAPATLLAQGVDFVDLDGPLLLARDCEPGLVYEGSTVTPPAPTLWG
jgi:L-alanine-DL-glutamate epimerase-like enolase superfamily enzyme